VINESDDSRVGSGRDGSSGGTLSHLQTNSASVASLGSTFVPVVIYAAICLTVFIVLRRKCPRAFAPRAIKGIPLAE
jgi:calcium permeable stress-gated cation channel